MALILDRVFHITTEVGWSGATNGENWQLVTDEPVEFAKYPVEVQNCRKIVDHSRRIY